MMSLLSSLSPVLVTLVRTTSSAKAQVDYPQPATPKEHLSKSAGAYLGAIEYLSKLKNSSNCRSALTSINVPDQGEVVNNES